MHTLKNFIENMLIKEIGEIQQSGHHYLSFGLISQGIEFLGGLLDDNQYFDENLSGLRFRKAIDSLFSVAYHQYNNKDKNAKYDLFRDLRCGLLHVCLPKPNIELIQEEEVHLFGQHLEIKTIRNRDALILVSQNYYNDFKNACEKVIAKIENGEIENPNLILTDP